ncbi:MAG: cbb3-type cytochrome oxidase assembly protein CcoS [Boseongicola sp. SB0673_bin_14]|nr:cbb3-type cytochrome oxidase assembly protein CcoS [Boseongicola sp. SB0673_bin_14]
MILGHGALAAFVWTVRSAQYDDPKGDAARILMDEDDPDSSLRQVNTGIQELVRARVSVAH